MGNLNIPVFSFCDCLKFIFHVFAVSLPYFRPCLFYLYFLSRLPDESMRRIYPIYTCTKRFYFVNFYIYIRMYHLYSSFVGRYSQSIKKTYVSVRRHLRGDQHQQHHSMSAVCCDGGGMGVGGGSRAGLRLSLNRSISEPGPTLPPPQPTDSKRFRPGPLPVLPVASLPASPNLDCVDLNDSLTLKKVRKPRCQDGLRLDSGQTLWIYSANNPYENGGCVVSLSCLLVY